MEGTRVNHLEEDSKVEVHGLVSQTALNGRRGTVVGMLPSCNMEGTRVNHLEEDSKVEVHGLVSQTALNGRRGTVVGMLPSCNMEGTRVNHLEEDSKVEVHGLVSQTALNGRRGTVVGMRNKQGRWPVVLDPDTSAVVDVVAGHGLAEGARVELKGLSAADLNGLAGTICGPQRSNGRWTVHVPAKDERVAIKAENLAVLAAAACLGASASASASALGASAAASASSGGANTKRWWLKPEALWVLLPCAGCGAYKRACKAFVKNASGSEIKRCKRCQRVWYCSPACQRADWKIHKKVCAAPVDCVICMDCEGFPLPIQTGCACRGESAWAHVSCKAQVAEHHGPGEFNKAWGFCLTCKQLYTGMFRLRLAREGLRRFAGSRPPEDADRLSAQDNVADALSNLGRHSEALAMKRENLAVGERVFGKDHPGTMTAASNLARSLMTLRNFQKAETLARSLLARHRAHPDFGKEHENTLCTASLLAQCLGMQGKCAEAAELHTATLATQRRVLGEDHTRTLETARALGQVLRLLGNHDEAVALLRDTHARSRRVLGKDHEVTLEAALFLGAALVRHPNASDMAEGMALITEALARARHVLGPGHPTLQRWEDDFS